MRRTHEELLQSIFMQEKSTQCTEIAEIPKERAQRVLAQVELFKALKLME